MTSNGTIVGRIAGSLPAAALGALSAVRGRRIFHPVGTAYAGSCHVPRNDTGDQLLPAGEHEAIVRFSRGAGLPTAVPDILGVAVKLPGLGADGGDQDLLLVSSAGPPGMRRLLLPGLGFTGRRFSSILAYRFRGGPAIVIGGRLTGAAARLADPEAAPRWPVATVHLEAATTLGDWSRVGTVEVGERLERSVADGLRFDPWDTSGDLRPAGLLNAVRGPAYTASQTARRLLGWREADREPTSITRIEIE